MRLLRLIFILLSATLSIESAKAFVVNGLAYTINEENSNQVWLTANYPEPIPGEITYAYEDPDVIPYKGNIIVPEHVTHEGKTYTVTGIDGAFKYAPELISVIVPGTVTIIKNGSFENCPKLQWIRFNPGDSGLNIVNSFRDGQFDSLYKLEIGREISGSFWGITTLKELIILSGCNTLDINQFKESYLESLIIEDSEEPIKLDQTPSYYINIQQYIYIGRNINRISFCGDFEQVEIGDYVTSLPDNLFQTSTNLHSVKIGAGLTEISNDCFYECENLEVVEIKSNVRSIGESAFYRNIRLKNIDFGSELIEIGTCAFSECSSLETFDFGDKITNIGWSAFQNCTALRELYLPASLMTVGGYAFSGLILDNMTIADSLDPLVLQGFRDLSGENIYIGRTLINWDDDVEFNCAIPAFKRCTFGPSINSVVSLNGNGTVEKIEFLGKFNEITNGCFADCVSLQEVSFASDINIIGELAFANCVALNNVNFGNNLKSIGNWAFAECNSLGRFVLPSTLEYIGLGALGFSCDELIVEYSENPLNCDPAVLRSRSSDVSVGKVIIDRIFSESPWFNELSNDIEVIFGDNIPKIQEQLFRGAKIESLTIGSNVSVIEYQAFHGISGLKSLVIPSNVKEIGFEAFLQSKDIESIILSEGIERIDASAFCGTGLREVTIPTTVSSIGNIAFNECSNLTSIVIEDSDSPLAFETGFYENFQNTDNIEYIYYGRNIENDTTPFSNHCSNLKEIEFGDNVTELAANAFNNCGALQKVTSMNPVPAKADDNTFNQQAYETAALIIPKKAKSAYAEAPMWRKFLNIETIAKIYNVTLSTETSGGIALLNGIETSSIEIEEDESLIITLIPDEFYKLATLIVNDENVTEKVVDNTYTIDSVDKDIHISVSFVELPKYVITTNCDSAHGKIYLNGYDSQSMILYEGQSLDIEIVPERGFAISSATINGKGIDIDKDKTTHKIESISEDINISCIFVEKIIAVTISDSECGSIMYEAKFGQDLKLKVNSNKGWRINTVTVNGYDTTDSVNADGWIVIETVEDDVDINVVYVKDDAGFMSEKLTYIKVYGRQNAIEICGNDSHEIVRVFNPSGLFVYEGCDDIIEVVKGIYLVNVAQQTFKVMVK